MSHTIRLVNQKFKSKVITKSSQLNDLLPKKLEKTLLTDDFVDTLMQFFYGVDQMILKITEDCAQVYAEKAFYDTLGGYLNYFIIPLCKLSYYAGVLTLKTTLHVYDLLEQCKIFLNTNGNGWLPPKNDFSDWNLKIEPLQIIISGNENETEKSACSHLQLIDDESAYGDDMIVSLPKLDPEEKGELTNIWLPFKNKQTFYLKSQHSRFLLLRYFVTVSRCYNHEGVDQSTFDKRFKRWLQENIEPHLTDEVLYPGLGAVLRILKLLEETKNKTIRSYTKQKPRHHHENEVPASCESPKPKKITPIGNLKPIAPAHTKPKTNFLRHFFDKSDDSELDPDEKGTDIKDEDNVKTVKKNYIITAIGVAVVLLIFICIVAVVTKNMRQLCKGKRKLKERKEKRKQTAKQRAQAGSNYGNYRYRTRERISTEEDTTSDLASEETLADLSRHYGGTNLDKRGTKNVMYSEATPLRYEESKATHYLEPSVQLYDEKRRQRSTQNRENIDQRVNRNRDKFNGQDTNKRYDDTKNKYYNESTTSHHHKDLKANPKMSPRKENTLFKRASSLDLDIENPPTVECQQTRNVEIRRSPPIERLPTLICTCDENTRKNKGRKTRAKCLNCFSRINESLSALHTKPEPYKVVCGPFGPTVSAAQQPLNPPSCSPPPKPKPKPKPKAKPTPKIEPLRTSPLRFSISKKNKERAVAGKEICCKTSPKKPKPCCNTKCGDTAYVIERVPSQTRCYHSDSTPRRTPDHSFDSSPKAKSDVVTPRTASPQSSPRRATFQIPYCKSKKEYIRASSSWETLDSRK